MEQCSPIFRHAVTADGSMHIMLEPRADGWICVWLVQGYTQHTPSICKAQPSTHVLRQVVVAAHEGQLLEPLKTQLMIRVLCDFLFIVDPRYFSKLHISLKSLGRGIRDFYTTLSLYIINEELGREVGNATQQALRIKHDPLDWHRLVGRIMHDGAMRDALVVAAAPGSSVLQQFVDSQMLPD